MGKLIFLWGCLLGILTLAMPAQAAQMLPNSPWYVVVYQPETDTLHWINTAGQQASIPRPHLPDEAAYRDLRISPNGRTLVIFAELNDGREALGIYDLATGSFVQTHQAQPGEKIYPGGENIFAANSASFAIGLYSGDFSNPAWRVIFFDAQTGSALAYIDHTHPDAPDVQLSAPAVQYLDGTYVHFQMIPQGVGAWHTWPAFAWRVNGFDPAAPLITESPFSRAEVQVQLLTGQVVLSYEDDNYAAAPPDGQTLPFNAVGWQVPTNETPITPVHADGSRYHLFSRWAKGGEWILFYSTDTQQNYYWNIILANGTPGNNSHFPFDPQYEQAFGTSDGYVLINAANGLYYSNGFSPTTAQNIGQLTPQGKVVYVTPIGVSFTLEQLGEGSIPPANPVVVVSPTPAVVVAEPDPADCSQAPSPRMTPGSQGRVLSSVTTLNVRNQPAGTVITAIAGGTTFNVIGGPICANTRYWWQMNGNGATGWVMEGVPGEYYIEPYTEVAPPAQPENPPPQQPPVVTGNEENPPAVPASEEGCQRAPEIYLAVGQQATLRFEQTPRNAAGGQALPYLIPNGSTVSIVEGPVCANGQRWWGVVGPTISVANGQPVNGVFWIPDGLRVGRSMNPA